MPTYDYRCNICEKTIEIFHSIKDDSARKCKKCKSVLEKQIGMGSAVIVGGLKGTIADKKQIEHTKRVKDLDRAVKRRKRAFGGDAVGNPVDRPDQKHVIKKGRTLGGNQMEVDKKEFIKAAARDPMLVNKAQEAVKKSETKKK